MAALLNGINPCSHCRPGAIKFNLEKKLCILKDFKLSTSEGYLAKKNTCCISVGHNAATMQYAVNMTPEPV